MDKSKVRVALVCNMNNMLSSLCRYLLSEGYDAHLYQFEGHPAHFDAHADTFTNIFENRLHQIKWKEPIDVTHSDNISVQDIFRNFDVIIGGGTSPAYIAKAGLILDMFIPYGSDIYDYPFFHFARNPLVLFKRLIFQYYQRKGIKEAKVIIMERQTDLIETKIATLKIKNRINCSIPMMHAETYIYASDGQLSKLKYYSRYKQIRDSSDLVIFHHSRHSWLNPKDKFELKGNDILFKGFALFKEKNPKIKARIVTLEYGDEVEESKALIKKLGITNEVIWMPLQDRKELMIGLSLCDLVVGELKSSFNLYGTTTEALQMGKPVMQNRCDFEFLEHYPNLHPIINAEDELSVCSGLEMFISNPEKMKEMGKLGREWYKANITENFLKIFEDIVRGKFSK